MGTSARVTNLTTGFRIKLAQAQRRVDQCASTWVEVGFSIRDLERNEFVAARSAKARQEAPLPYSEVFGLKWDHEDVSEERRGVHQAHNFALDRHIENSHPQIEPDCPICKQIAARNERLTAQTAIQ